MLILQWVNFVRVIDSLSDSWFRCELGFRQMRQSKVFGQLFMQFLGTEFVTEFALISIQFRMLLSACTARLETLLFPKAASGP